MENTNQSNPCPYVTKSEFEQFIKNSDSSAKQRSFVAGIIGFVVGLGVGIVGTMLCISIITGGFDMISLHDIMHNSDIPGSIQDTPENNHAFYPDYTIKKPIIYTYGYDGEVTVKLDFDENTSLKYAYPAYNDGWTFNVIDDKFCDNDKTYDYLYYEAITENEFDMTEGFCIKGSDTVEFLEDKLKEFGLTDCEAQDFITYWMPYMCDNNYNVISFVDDQYNDMVSLDVTPKADSVIRIYMVFYASDDFVEIPEQNIHTYERIGKTVVEWGGTEIQR